MDRSELLKSGQELKMDHLALLELVPKPRMGHNFLQELGQEPG